MLQLGEGENRCYLGAGNEVQLPSRGEVRSSYSSLNFPRRLIRDFCRPNVVCYDGDKMLGCLLYTSSSMLAEVEDAPELI
jgi:hypothetical protein